MVTKTVQKFSPTLQKLERKGQKIESLPLFRHDLVKCAIAKERGNTIEAKSYAYAVVHEAVDTYLEGKPVYPLPIAEIEKIVYWSRNASSCREGTAGSNAYTRAESEESRKLADGIMSYDFFNHPYLSRAFFNDSFLSRLLKKIGVTTEYFKPRRNACEVPEKTMQVSEQTEKRGE